MCSVARYSGSDAKGTRAITKAGLAPGFGSALSTVGFGAMIAFSALLSAQHGWSPVWLTFSAFASALVAARLFLGHIPDMLGGAKVALICVFVEAAGLALIWFAPNPALAAAGAALTGVGYSLVYPGLGMKLSNGRPKPQPRRAPHRFLASRWVGSPVGTARRREEWLGVPRQFNPRLGRR